MDPAPASFVPTSRMVDDALRFMRVPPDGRDKGLIQATREAFAKLESFVRPRSVWGRFPVSCLAGADLGDDLTRLLSGSRECFLLAVTLGPEVDRQISLAQRRGMGDGLALDACASVRADALCDEVQEEIEAGLGDGEGLTMRFSPGYGDAPLSLSQEIILCLNATRRIGLSMTRSLMMTPVKSVTAVLGVTEAGPGQRSVKAGCDGKAGCSLCPAREGCMYRA
ncbi:MAG: methionine synthase [Synergistaceae bacterium]|nr:methionine synthase [Synergistaceae bacterium]